MSRERVYMKGQWVQADTPEYKQMQENLRLVRDALVDLNMDVSAGIIIAGTNVDVNRDAIRQLVEKWQRLEDQIGHGMSELVDVVGETFVRG